MGPPPPHGGARASQPLQGIPISQPIDSTVAAKGYDDRYSNIVQEVVPHNLQQLSKGARGMSGPLIASKLLGLMLWRRWQGSIRWRSGNRQPAGPAGHAAGGQRQPGRPDAGARGLARARRPADARGATIARSPVRPGSVKSMSGLRLVDAQCAGRDILCPIELSLGAISAYNPGSHALQILRAQAAGQPAPPSAATTAAARAARKRKLKEAPASPEPEGGKAELRMVGLGCKAGWPAPCSAQAGVAPCTHLQESRLWQARDQRHRGTVHLTPAPAHSLVQVKNRESAARSRQRKQAYTNDLEAQVTAAAMRILLRLHHPRWHMSS